MESRFIFTTGTLFLAVLLFGLVMMTTGAPTSDDLGEGRSGMELDMRGIRFNNNGSVCGFEKKEMTIKVKGKMSEKSSISNKRQLKARPDTKSKIKMSEPSTIKHSVGRFKDTGIDKQRPQPQPKKCKDLKNKKEKKKCHRRKKRKTAKAKKKQMRKREVKIFSLSCKKSKIPNITCEPLTQKYGRMSGVNITIGCVPVIRRTVRYIDLQGAILES